MVLGDIDRVRRLSGNPSTSNVSDGDITSGLEYGTSRAISFTGKSDWVTDTSHPSYAAIVQAVEYFASSMIRDRFQDQSDISTEHYRRGENILRDLMNNLYNVASVVAVARGNYRSYPLNSSATIYRSMLGQGQILIGVGDYIPVQY